MRALILVVEVQAHPFAIRQGPGVGLPLAPQRLVRVQGAPAGPVCFVQRPAPHAHLQVHQDIVYILAYVVVAAPRVPAVLVQDPAPVPVQHGPLRPRARRGAAQGSYVQYLIGKDAHAPPELRGHVVALHASLCPGKTQR